MKINYEVKITEEAQVELDQILQHYQTKGGDQLADTVAARITDDILIFEGSPRVGKKYKRHEQRVFPIYGGRYIVAYILDEKNAIVHIIAIKSIIGSTL